MSEAVATRCDRLGASSSVELEAYVTSDARPMVAIVVREQKSSRGSYGDRVETFMLDAASARQLLGELYAALEALR